MPRYMCKMKITVAILYIAGCWKKIGIGLYKIVKFNNVKVKQILKNFITINIEIRKYSSSNIIVQYTYMYDVLLRLSCLLERVLFVRFVNAWHITHG